MSDGPTKHLPRTADEMLVEILKRLECLEASVDQRLKQTTPLSAQLAELRERIETGFRDSIERHDRMERESIERQDRTEKELREISRTLRRMNVDLATALRDQDELGDRVTALETQISQTVNPLHNARRGARPNDHDQRTFEDLFSDRLASRLHDRPITYRVRPSLLLYGVARRS